MKGNILVMMRNVLVTTRDILVMRNVLVTNKKRFDRLLSPLSFSWCYYSYYRQTTVVPV